MVLGSGTGLITPKRFGPAYLLGNEEFSVLVDCGPGTLIRLGQMGLDATKISSILFTHFHIDHCSELAPILFARRSPELPRAESVISLVGLGLSEHYSSLQRLHGRWVEPREGPPNLLELQNPCFRLGPWTIKWARTNHIQSSVAYRFEDKDGRSLVLSGDTGPCDDLVDLARGADTLVLECSFPDPSPYPGHLSPRTAGELAAATGCDRLVLTHFYPCLENQEIVEKVRESYSGSVLCADDLLTLTW